MNAATEHVSTQAVIEAKLLHAMQHQQQTADRTAPHWVWLQRDGEAPELYREYPLQGLRVRQSDVTLFH